MAKLLKVDYPAKFEKSLAQMGRLHTDGRLIIDDEGGLKNVLGNEKTVKGVTFLPLDLGYLGVHVLVQVDQAVPLMVPGKRAMAWQRSLESQVMREASENA